MQDIIKILEESVGKLVSLSDNRTVLQIFEGESFQTYFRIVRVGDGYVLIKQTQKNLNYYIMINQLAAIIVNDK